ncbi:hypothetical protein N7522_012931 [Penicillium canescens]|nr:hypothetical protein N7522_012931 [Penicillium canescens]
MKAHSLVILFWVLGGVTTVVVALRIFAKARIGRLKVDDATMMIAWGMFSFQSVGSHPSCFFRLQALAIVASTLFTIAVHYGYGQDIWELDFDSAVHVFKFYTITQACVIGSSTAGRVAFVLYLQAILGGETKHRIILLTLAILEVTFNAVSIILIFTGCKDLQLQSTWNKGLPRGCLTRQARYAYFQTAFNTAVDLYLVIVPTCIFWGLNLRLGVRVSLIVLMSLGLFAMAASLAKTVSLKDITSPNFTGATFHLVRWGLVESYIVIITASLPCLRSLVVSSIHHMTSRQQHTDFDFICFNGASSAQRDRSSMSEPSRQSYC